MDRKPKDIPHEIIYLASVVVIVILHLVGLTSVATPIVNSVFTPLMFLSSEAGNEIRSAYESIGSINSIRNERNELLVENAELKAENSTVLILKDEIEVLSSELKLGKQDTPGVLATVVNNGNEEVTDFMLLNKGSDDGVSEGDVAHIGNIYVGVVKDIDDKKSRIVLPTYGKSFLEVVVIPKQENIENLKLDEMESLIKSPNIKIWKGVAVGGSNVITVQNIEKNAPVKVGDHVFVNDSDVGILLYLGDLNELSSEPSDVGIEADVKTPLNFRNITKLMIMNSGG